METLEQPESASSSTKPDLNLILARERADDWRRWRSSAAVSIGIHSILIVALLLMPGSLFKTFVPDEQDSVHVTPVFEPTELTQTTPNKGPVTKEITAEAITPRPLVKTPGPAPAATQAPTPAPPPPPAAAPPPVVAQAPPKPVVIEPPTIQPDPKALQTPDIATLIPAPLPSPAPKPTLQNVQPTPNPAQGRNGSIVAIPNPSVEEAVRNLTRTAPQGGQSVGDLGADEGGRGLGLNLPPSAG